jgi:hypothetical protein
MEDITGSQITALEIKSASSAEIHGKRRPKAARQLLHAEALEASLKFSHIALVGTSQCRSDRQLAFNHHTATVLVEIETEETLISIWFYCIPCK